MKTIIKKVAEFNETWDKQSLAFMWFMGGLLAGALLYHGVVGLVLSFLK